MPNLKEVKNRINSVTSTQQITKAMKMVAAAKLRRAQERIVQMRPYAQKLNTIIKKVNGGSENELDALSFTNDRGADKVLLVVVSSDRGLCGAFNSNIFKATVAKIKEAYAPQAKRGNVTILPIGKRAYDFFKKRDYPVVSDYYQIMATIAFEDVREVAEYIMDAYESELYDRVELVYNEFKNVATQVLTIEQYLPIVPEVADDKMMDIDYIFEPSKKDIVNELIPKSLKIQLYKALLESNASEQGARMTAMDQATDNAGELIKQLKLTYNRTRQAAITKEILEIVGGADALKGN